MKMLGLILLFIVKFAMPSFLDNLGIIDGFDRRARQRIAVTIGAISRGLVLHQDPVSDALGSASG
jgi:hypothetical protein